jgi:hypothetical protein
MFGCASLGRPQIATAALLTDGRRLVSIRRFDRIVKDGRGAFAHMQVPLAEDR